MLTTAQLHAITQLADQWSFLWVQQLWIAAEDSPNGEQICQTNLRLATFRVTMSRDDDVSPDGPPGGRTE